MKATINNCHDEQILKELWSIFERGLIQKEIILSVDDAQNEEEAYNVICTKYGISHKTADFIFHTTFNHWFSLNYEKVKSAYDSIARETLGRNSFHNGINMDYYIPLLKTFCQKTMSIYDKGYDHGGMSCGATAGSSSARTNTQDSARRVLLLRPVAASSAVSCTPAPWPVRWCSRCPRWRTSPTRSARSRSGRWLSDGDWAGSYALDAGFVEEAQGALRSFFCAMWTAVSREDVM